jgi:HD-like signal output (HDOD) protein
MPDDYVLADHFGRDYALVCLAADKTSLPLLSAELDQFEASHADVGGYLLGLWGLPQDLIEAVAFHHDPSAHEVNRFSPLAAVHVANALVHAANGSDGDAEASQPRKLDVRYLERLRCIQRVSAWRSMAGDLTSAVMV